MQDQRPRRRAERIVRRALLQPVRIALTRVRPAPPKRLSPLIVLYTYAAMIAIGTFFLSLPIANEREGGFTPFMNAFFTASSAVTSTGLAVVDTPTYWSGFGKAVLVILIQLGGLGLIALATLVFITIGRRIGLRERLQLRDTSGFAFLGGAVRVAKALGIAVLAIEALGVIALTIRFAFDFSFPTALWHAFFLSLSAFNNAGFDILPHGGLAAYRDDTGVLLITAALVMLGGISIAVIVNVLALRKGEKLTLDTKMVLLASLALWVFGTLLFLASEYDNAGTLGPLGWPRKVLDSFFESVMARTSGLTAVSVGGFKDVTLFIFTWLMFIGGVAGSTAGGIKVNTFSVIVASVVAAIRGRPQVEAFRREIAYSQVFRALTVAVLGLAVVFLSVVLLTALEEGRFINLLFESVSAFGTVGFSAGVTSTLSTAGQVVIIFTMVLGEVGPLTLVLALAQRHEPVPYRFAEERVRIG